MAINLFVILLQIIITILNMNKKENRHGFICSYKEYTSIYAIINILTNISFNKSLSFDPVIIGLENLNIIIKVR